MRAIVSTFLLLIFGCFLIIIIYPFQELGVYMRPEIKPDKKDKIGEETEKEKTNSIAKQNIFPGMRNKHCVAECQQYLKDQPASNKTLCGLNAELRGRHQKIISYCFFGNLKSVYYDGIQDNLKSLDKYYPGWIMRLYLDPTKLDNNASNNLCTLSCDTNRMDVCSVKSLGPYGDISGKFGMVWRFLPMADPFVDFMVSRDLDSRFSVREKSAVDDWISSELPFHAMRDHPYHRTPILGGMWGARMDLGNRQGFKSLVKTMLKKMSNSWKKGYDQHLLTQYVWPAVKKTACVHDSYLCNSYPAPNNRPWPTKRKNEPGNFAASNGVAQISYTCPKNCRPKDHLDWTKC